MEINHHHVIYEKRLANRDHVMGRLRNYAGLIILTNVYDHRRLHRDLGSVPFPDRQVARQMMINMPPREVAQPRDYQLAFCIDFLLAHEQTDTAEHLMAQREYIMRTPLPYEERHGA